MSEIGEQIIDGLERFDEGGMYVTTFRHVDDGSELIRERRIVSDVPEFIHQLPKQDVE